MTTSMLTVEIEDPTGPDAEELIRQLTAELGALYGYEVAGRFSPADVKDVPRAAFVVARRQGLAVGCGAIRPFVDDPTSVEVKRMFVAPEVRGQGISRLILRKLESLATAFGYNMIKLETGDLQTEAIGLYESAGYERIPCYGKYAGQPFSICFAKQVKPANDA